METRYDPPRDSSVSRLVLLLGLLLTAGLGGGAFAAVTVSAPNGGEIWSTGVTHAVTWTSTPEVINVAIDYSTDNGATWVSVTASTPSTGTYDWPAPATPSLQCRVRVSDTADPAGWDMSNNVFVLTDQDDAYEENDDQAHATVVTTGTYPDLRIYVHPELGSVDADWYAVYLDAGEDLRVTLAAQPVTPGEYLDVDFEIRDAAGTRLVYALSDSATETLCLADRLPGWYYILPTYADTLCDYTLTVEVGDLDVGAIYGRVTDGGGGGIANVQVEFLDPSGSWTLMHGAVLTDAAGYYGYGGNPGDYVVYFNPVTFGLNYVIEYYNDKATFATADPVTITAGGSTTAIDAVLTTGGTISGHVTRQSDGSNLGGVTVRAYDPVSRLPLRITTTNTSGDYTIVGLPAGDVKVRFNRSTFGIEWYNDKTSFGDADLLTVTSGGALSGIDAALAAQGRLQGMVYDDATGVPLAGINVRSYDASNFLISSVNTSSSGYYNLPAMPSSWVRVQLIGEPLGYATEWLYDRSTFESADPIQIISGFTATAGDAHLNPCVQILEPPRNQAVTSGHTATLTVNVYSTQSVSYQWYEGLSGDTSTPIAGATDDSYTTPPLASGSFPYWVRVSAPCRNVDSDTATVTVVAECLTPSAPLSTVPAVAQYDEDYLLDWTDTCPEGYYEGQESLLPDFAVFEYGYIDGTSVGISHNPPEPTYYFYRVRAVRVCDGVTYLSDWSPICHTAVTGSAYEPADVDLDGDVDAGDLQLLAAFLAGSNDLAAAAAADLDGNAAVNGVDLDFLLQFLAGNFKQEGLEAGVK